MDEATKLIIEKGVKGSSVDRILKKSDAGKSQFYHYFKNKEDLVIEIVNYYGCKVLDSHIKSLEQVQDLEDMIHWVKSSFVAVEMEEKKIGGCLFGTIINDVGNEKTNKIKKEIIAVFDHWAKIITEKLEELKHHGYFVQEMPCKEIAVLLIIIFEGGSLISKVYENSFQLKLGLQHYCMYLKNYVSPTYYNKIMKI